MTRFDKIMITLGVAIAIALTAVLVRDINRDAELRTKDACYRLAYHEASGQQARTKYYDNCMGK